MSLRVAVGGNFAILGVLLNYKVPVVIRALLPVPNMALQNAIACRVFRYLRLGYIKRSPERFRSSASGIPNVTHPIKFISPPGLITSNISVSGHSDDVYQPQRSVVFCGNEDFSFDGIQREQENKPITCFLAQPADSRV